VLPFSGAALSFGSLRLFARPALTWAAPLNLAFS
jgi:hypothetical protein